MKNVQSTDVLSRTDQDIGQSTLHAEMREWLIPVNSLPVLFALDSPLGKEEKGRGVCVCLSEWEGKRLVRKPEKQLLRDEDLQVIKTPPSRVWSRSPVESETCSCDLFSEPF